MNTPPERIDDNTPCICKRSCMSFAAPSESLRNRDGILSVVFICAPIPKQCPINWRCMELSESMISSSMSSSSPAVLTAQSKMSVSLILCLFDRFFTFSGTITTSPALRCESAFHWKFPSFIMAIG